MKPDQTGEAEIPRWEVKVRHIYLSSGHDYWGKQGEGRMCHGIQEVGEVECVAGMGLRGDRYFGYREDFKGQVTFFDEEVFLEIRQRFKLPKLPASVFRRNVIIAGADLAKWKGKRFELQGICFEGSQECTPCDWMNRVIAPGAQDFMKEAWRGGLRAKIHTSGMLRKD